MIPSLLEEILANFTFPYSVFLMRYKLTVEVIVAACNAKALGEWQTK